MPELLSPEELFKRPVKKESTPTMDWLIVPPEIKIQQATRPGFESYVLEDALRYTDATDQLNIRAALMLSANTKLSRGRIIHNANRFPVVTENVADYISTELYDPLKVERVSITTLLSKGKNLASNGFYFYRHHQVSYALYALNRGRLINLANRLFASRNPSHPPAQLK